MNCKILTQLVKNMITAKRRMTNVLICPGEMKSQLKNANNILMVDSYIYTIIN